MNIEMMLSQRLRTLYECQGGSLSVREVISGLSASDLLTMSDEGSLLQAEAAMGNDETCYLLLRRANHLNIQKKLLNLVKKDGWTTALHTGCCSAVALYGFANKEIRNDKAEDVSNSFQLARIHGHCDICLMLRASLHCTS